MKQARVDELMDDPGLDPARHAAALNGLARLNKASLGAKYLWDEIARVARANSTDKLKILEIASGGGDIVLELAKRAKKSSLKLQITGSDRNSTAVEIARKKFAREYPEVQFISIDALADQFPTDFDIVTTSLFTHHLDGEEVILLLRKMYEAAGKCVIVSDLERSALNYSMVWIATRVLTTSDVVRFDGPVSVRAAYTAPEFLELSKQAGLRNATVKRVFPCRFLFSAQKNGS